MRRRAGSRVRFPRRTRTPGCVAALAIVALVCVACGSGTTPSSDPASAAPSSTTRPRVTVPTTTLDPGQVVGAPSTPTTVPHERGTRPISPVVDNGQQIIITAGGFSPHQLFADVADPVTWTNLSGKTQQLVFTVLPVKSPPIPAGAQFVWHPSTAITIAYHSTTGLQGVLTLQPNGNG